MSRLALTFECQSRQLAGTLDTAPGKVGLLIVSGGNEIRAGAFSGQSLLAAKIAEAGFPVFRYDRRGVGDSDGENRGFRKSAKDILAARHAFEAMAPQVDRMIAFGNCDAASALMIDGSCEFDGLILSNPWIFDEENDDTLPPSAIRSRYLEKLKNPKEALRLVTGGVNLRKLFSGLRQAAKPASNTSQLAQDVENGLRKKNKPYRILLAKKDRTAQAFELNWDGDDKNIRLCEDASHAYVEPNSRAWLEQQILEMLRA